MPYIVIYNPVSDHGHLDSWNALFIRVLLEAKWKVLAITPNPETLVETLRRHECINLDALITTNLNNRSKLETKKNKLKNSFFRNYWRKIKTAGHNFVFYQSDKSIGKFQLFWVKLFGVFYLAAHFMQFYLLPRFYKKSQKNSQIYFSPYTEVIQVEKIIDEFRLNPCVVFHMYLDLLNFSSSFWDQPLPTLKYKWAGIRFAPDSNDRFNFPKFKNLQGVAYLDEHVLNRMKSYQSDLKFVFLPDITDSNLFNPPSDLAKFIARKSNGRKIIFLGGIIGVQKNLHLWLKLIDSADPNKWFFVQAGELDFKSLKITTFLAVYKKMIFRPDNFFLIPSFIKDERLFNEILAASDIVFAVYKNFKNSSNMITKSATFHKPIMVSNQFLMGQRVKQFDIGVAVPENSLQALLDVLEDLDSKTYLPSHFSDYNKAFSIEVLKNQFLEFINEFDVHQE